MRETGDQFEERAAAMVLDAGFAIIDRNFNTKVGEIDIIAHSSETLVFIEVRARSNTRFHGAAASVSRSKQQRLIRTAQYYLKSHPRWRNSHCRFDVIAFEPPQSNSEQSVRWIEGAFTA
ncbi:MAG: YraN family protein [Halioglobus sp.]